MNREFLYKKVRAIGDIDDSGNSGMDNWFEDNSWGELKMLLSESCLEDLIVTLAEIFKEGNPNYKELTIQLEVPYGKRQKNHEVVETHEENLIIWNLYEIDRTDKDIEKVEMHIDRKSLIIRKLYLYLHELTNMELLKNKINITYDNISYGAGNELVISEKECTLYVLNSQ